MTKLPALEARIAISTRVSGRVSGVSADTDVIAVFQDHGKKPVPPKGPYGALVERLRKSEAFIARHSQMQYIRFAGREPAENVLAIGLGAASELNEEKLRLAGGSVWQKLCAEKCKSAVIHADTFFEAKGGEVSHSRRMRVFAEGLVLGAYQFNKYKSNVEKSADDYQGPSRIVFFTQEKTLKLELDRELPQVSSIALAVNVTRDWSNEPSNEGTPEYYAAEAVRLARQFGLKTRVLTEQDARREGMGLFLGVGQGSDRDGRIVVVEYSPQKTGKGGKSGKSASQKTVALVGKGITFDSGGISIKPSLKMEEMKHDMTGAATVMGAVILASQWRISNRVVAIMGFTENMPSGHAIQPGNILKARSGKTVEVINTDAEGRLILADLLDFAQELRPDAIVDVATLTGAVTIALGKHCCAVLGNDEEMIEAIRRAGSANGERIWELPLWDDYFEDMKSDFADMKNSVNDPYGGTIRGAIFLKQFVKKGTPWAHLDIAATATGLGHLPYYPKKGASGAYVRTLAQFASDL